MNRSTFLLAMVCVLARKSPSMAFSSLSSFTGMVRRGYSRAAITMKLQTAIVGMPNVGG